MAGGAKIQNAAQRWLSGMQGASSAYIAGTSAPKRNPMQAAKAQLGLYLQRVNDAVNSGRMAAALDATPITAYTDGCKTKGAQNLVAGATRGQSKVASHFQRWGPIYQAASDAAAAIPRTGDISGALAKIQASLQVMMQAKGS